MFHLSGLHTRTVGLDSDCPTVNIYALWSSLKCVCSNVHNFEDDEVQQLNLLKGFTTGRYKNFTTRQNPKRPRQRREIRPLHTSTAIFVPFCHGHTFEESLNVFKKTFCILKRSSFFRYLFKNLLFFSRNN